MYACMYVSSPSLVTHDNIATLAMYIMSSVYNVISCYSFLLTGPRRHNVTEGGIRTNRNLLRRINTCKGWPKCACLKKNRHISKK
jgi:hypothetical protein